MIEFKPGDWADFEGTKVLICDEGIQNYYYTVIGHRELYRSSKDSFKPFAEPKSLGEQIAYCFESRFEDPGYSTKMLANDLISLFRRADIKEKE